MGAILVTLGDDSENRKYVTENGKNYYESQEEMLEHMKDERYKHDVGYRAKVQEMISNSDAVMLGVSAGESDYDGSTEDTEIVYEQAKKLFGDLRYATSPTYRREVQEYLKNNATGLDTMLQPFINPHAKGTIRVQFHGEETGPMAPAPTPNTTTDGDQ